jgi:hypothetical protein
MVFNNNLLLGAAGQSGAFDTTLIERSAWFDGAADYMTRQNGSAFANTKEAIFSFWIKRCKFSTQQAFFGSSEIGQSSMLQFESTDKLWIYLNSTDLKTTAVYRDTGWYHILVSFDTSQATASDRTKLWVNGEQVTSFSTAAYPTQNAALPGLAGEQTGVELMRIGNLNNTEANYYFWNGYVAQACMLESVSIQQGDYAVSDFLDTYTFGANGSQYVPRADAAIAALATAAGGNSFCLTTAIGDGTDASANGNNFTPTSMSDAANGSADTPSDSYTLLNPLDVRATTYTTVGLANGNLDLTYKVGNAARSAFGDTLGGGQWVFEVTMVTAVASIAYVGWSAINVDLNNIGTQGPVVFYASNGNKYVSSTSGTGAPTLSAYGATYNTIGDVIRVEADFTASTVEFFKNGTSQGSISISGMNDGTVDYFPSVYGSNASLRVNFGQQPFIGTPTAGFKALSTANRPTPDYQGADYFTVTLAQEADIEADVASAVADWSSNVTLYKNLAVAENWIHRFSSDASNEYLTGDNASPTYQSTSTLTGTNNWVAFSFRTENQAYQETGISHTNGAVTTVTHNLGNADAMILLYNRSGTGNIFIYAPQLTAGKLLKLNTNAAEAVDTSIQNVLANSFDIGSTQATGTYDVFILLNGDVFGVTSYIGNGAANGSFLPLSFKPQFMYHNRINSTSDAPFLDSTRDDTGNVTNDALFINLNDVEYPDIATYASDFLASGIKFRATQAGWNGGSIKYFVLAVADIAGGGDLPPIYGR